MTTRNAVPFPAGGLPPAGGAAGLVPFKTSGNGQQITNEKGSMISFAAPIVAERRIKRLKKSVWASGHLHGLAENGHRAHQCWFVTLTYRGIKDWQPRHISEAIRKYRTWCKRKGVPCRYTWVAELQSRGAVHYHLLAWLPQGVRMPQWDRTYGTSSCFWPHGMSNTQKALSGVGYLMKYLSKLGEFTIFPKGLRLYGIGGLNTVGRNVRSWLNLPEWVKRLYGVGEVKRQRTGFVVSGTGEMVQPAYAVCRVPFGLVLRSLRELPARFWDGAYSSVSFA